MNTVKNLENLALLIQQTNQHFLNKAQQQVNTALTILNWVIGYYILEYEQSGKDRADYGVGLFKALAQKLTQKGLKSIRERHLYLCKDFYQAYPQILRTPTAKSHLIDYQQTDILRAMSAESAAVNPSQTDLNALITSLSFSHFVELLKADNDAKRRFYEAEAIRNNWSVRTLKRAIESLLYERTGLSRNKLARIKEFTRETDPLPEAVFHNTYLLEFLGLEEKAVFTESDLEESIITNLQHFLLELGRGFCFEHRQRRITFDNKHYRIDLVFYHRIHTKVSLLYSINSVIPRIYPNISRMGLYIANQPFVCSTVSLCFVAKIWYLLAAPPNALCKSSNEICFCISIVAELFSLETSTDKTSGNVRKLLFILASQFPQVIPVTVYVCVMYLYFEQQSYHIAIPNLLHNYGKDLQNFGYAILIYISILHKTSCL